MTKVFISALGIQLIVICVSAMSVIGLNVKIYMIYFFLKYINFDKPVFFSCTLTSSVTIMNVKEIFLFYQIFHDLRITGI